MNSGIALLITSPRPTARTGITNKKITAILPPMINAMTKANTSISGQRIAIRTIIMYAICTLEISVVSLVTRDDVENLSILANEKFWIL